MELIILNENFQIVDIIDTFESIIWTERYNSYGDFEIFTKISNKLLYLLEDDYYIRLTNSERIMIIEDCNIKTDVESGNTITITGRSIESIIDRRIIWTQTVLNDGLQNGIKTLLNNNVISPLEMDRQISNFIFDESVNPTIIALTVNAQYLRDNLYGSIEKLCITNDLGFRVVLSDSNQLAFQLYYGIDRSYDQIENPYVVFSPEFDNIINSEYAISKKLLKTLTVVLGEGEEGSRKTKIVGGGIGLDRREMYTDAGISQTVDEVLMSDNEYYAQLEQKGIEDLITNSIDNSFDSKVDTTRMYEYEKDFFLGDIVQMVSEYGIQAKARITEIIRTQSTSGIEIYPKFTIIK